MCAPEIIVNFGGTPVPPEHWTKSPLG